MRKFFGFALLAIFLLGGCHWNERPEELERLVKEDPAFKQMIAQRDETRAQIKLIKDDLLNRKRALDSQVEKLREQYDLYAKAQNRKIEGWRATVEANRARLKSEIETADASITAKQAEFEGYQKTLVDVQKVLKESKGITLSLQEKKKWEERILLLNEKMRPLNEDIQDLKLKIRLKKQKIGYLD